MARAAAQAAQPAPPGFRAAAFLWVLRLAAVATPPEEKDKKQTFVGPIRKLQKVEVERSNQIAIKKNEVWLKHILTSDRVD